MPLKIRKLLRWATPRAIILLSCFVVQWSGLVLLYKHLDPGPQIWSVLREPARSRTGNGVFLIYGGMGLLLPEWDSGLIVGGVPLKFEPFPRTSVGYISDIHIWDSQERPSNDDLPWIDPPAWSRLAEDVDIDELIESRYFRVIETAVGWPVPAIRGRVHLKMGEIKPTGGEIPWIDPKYGWAVPASAWRPVRNSATYPAFEYPFLPLRPLIWGSLINTLFLALVYGIFAKAASLMLHIFPKYRENIRRSRSHCPKCDYDLGSLTRCPECGYADAHKTAQSTPKN